MAKRESNFEDNQRRWAWRALTDTQYIGAQIHGMIKHMSATPALEVVLMVAHSQDGGMIASCKLMRGPKGTGPQIFSGDQIR